MSTESKNTTANFVQQFSKRRAGKREKQGISASRSHAPANTSDTNTSAWRFVKAALAIECATSTQKLLLILLAGYAGKEGVCWPSYETLMRKAKIGSKATVIGALTYLRDDLKIVRWKKGWGNQHGHSKPNIYTFDYAAMSALARPNLRAELGAEESTVVIEESSINRDSTVEESSVSNESIPGKVQPVNAKVLDQCRNVQVIKATVQGSGSAVPAVDFPGRQDPTRRESPNLGQSSINELSSQSTPSELSSIRVSPALAYHTDFSAWGARSDIDRPLTRAEMAEMKYLNDNRIRPN